MIRFTRLSAAMCAAGLTGCLHATSPFAPLPPGNNILFIGNSLTYANDLPGLVAGIAQVAGVTLQVASLAAANHSLIDFVLDGSAQSRINQGGWKYVVMQQGPTTLPICRDTLVLATKAMDVLAKNIGAKSLVMMSWPSMNRQFDLAKVHESAQMAAATVGGQLAPVGDAWALAMVGDPTLAMYSADGFHPSITGSYLAALVIFEQITGLDARNLPATPPNIVGLSALSSAAISRLQQAAHSANADAFLHPVPVWVPSTPPVPPITC